MMIAAIYARKSTDQSGIAAEQESVARQIEHGRAFTAANANDILIEALLDDVLDPTMIRDAVDDALTLVSESARGANDRIESENLRRWTASSRASWRRSLPVAKSPAC
jgi:hypothetical protein